MAATLERLDLWIGNNDWGSVGWNGKQQLIVTTQLKGVRITQNHMKHLDSTQRQG